MRTNLILQDALIEFVVDCKLAFENHPMLDQFTLSLYNQLSRSSASAALNYAEGTGSGSDRDYANKLRIAYKEMREVKQTIRILMALNSNNARTDALEKLLRDADRLAGVRYSCCRKAESKFK